MKGAFLLFLMIVLIFNTSCSVKPEGREGGIGVLFDGDPTIFDESVYHMGSVVGQIHSRESGWGVTRIVIVFDGPYEQLKKSNMVAVVKNGQICLADLATYNDSVPEPDHICGYESNLSYQWFKLKHIMGNINMASHRRVQALLTRSGLDG